MKKPAYEKKKIFYIVFWYNGVCSCLKRLPSDSRLTKFLMSRGSYEATTQLSFRKMTYDDQTRKKYQFHKRYQEVNFRKQNSNSERPALSDLVIKATFWYHFEIFKNWTLPKFSATFRSAKTFWIADTEHSVVWVLSTPRCIQKRKAGDSISCFPHKNAMC